MASASAIKPSRVSPKFLHSNAMSHTWVFSAIAELIDNACDTGVDARDLWIDLEVINGINCLTFLDNGSGMHYESLHKMLSFGYSEKEDLMNKKAIGRYGNGFKSGSMRLGRDALVITKCSKSLSVGFLSRTYLEAIGADSVLIPIATWFDTPSGLNRKKSAESNESLRAILEYSPFNSEARLLEQLGENKNGTKIVIFNLNTDNAGKLELDFVSDVYDIRNPETADMESSVNDRNRTAGVIIPEYRKSLRAYCSILYLKPSMRIFLRKLRVENKWIVKSLSKPEEDVYKPAWADKRQGVKLTFGFTKDKSGDAPYGLMLYHKNRLIQAYKKIGCQNKATGEGAGVICVVEANFLEPTHNKQDFNQTGRYTSFINSAARKLKDYYDHKVYGSSASDATEEIDNWNWVQCDNCMSWRRLPSGYEVHLDTSKNWYCKNNPDVHYNRCDIPEESEGDDESIVSPKPSYKKKGRAEQKKQAKPDEEGEVKVEEDILQKDPVAADNEKRLKEPKETKLIVKIGKKNINLKTGESARGGENAENNQPRGQRIQRGVARKINMEPTKAVNEKPTEDVLTPQCHADTGTEDTPTPQMEQSSSLDKSLKRKNTNKAESGQSPAKRRVIMVPSSGKGPSTLPGSETTPEKSKVACNTSRNTGLRSPVSMQIKSSSSSSVLGVPQNLNYEAIVAAVFSDSTSQLNSRITVAPEAGDFIRQTGEDGVQRVVPEIQKTEKQMEPEQLALKGIVTEMDKVLDASEGRKVFKEQASQTETLSWNCITSQEVERLETSLSEERQALRQKTEELERTNQEFSAFRRNVYDLLKELEPNGEVPGGPDNVCLVVATYLEASREQNKK